MLPAARFLLPVLVLSCTSPEIAPPPSRGILKIGALFPVTGSASGKSQDILRGIELALEESRHQAGGFEIRLEEKDHELAAGTWNSQIRHRETLIEELCDDPEVMAVIGPFNAGMAEIAIPPMNRSHLLLISPTASAIGLTRPSLRPTGRVNFARMVPADDVQGAVAAEWIQKSGIRRVFVIDDEMAGYGKAIADRFARRAGELGLTVLGRRSVNPESPDLPSLAREILSTQPEVIYLGGTTATMKNIAWTLVATDGAVKLLAPDGCFEKEFLDLVGPDRLEGRCFLTSSQVPPDRLAMWATFGSGGRRGPPIETALGYEAARVILAAIRKVGAKDRGAIRDAVLATRDFDGILGRWSFDANGDTTRRTHGIYGVRKGKFDLVEILN